MLDRNYTRAEIITDTAKARELELVGKHVAFGDNVPEVLKNANAGNFGVLEIIESDSDPFVRKDSGYAYDLIIPCHEDEFSFLHRGDFFMYGSEIYKVRDYDGYGNLICWTKRKPSEETIINRKDIPSLKRMDDYHYIERSMGNNLKIFAEYYGDNCCFGFIKDDELIVLHEKKEIRKNSGEDEILGFINLLFIYAGDLRKEIYPEACK